MSPKAEQAILVGSHLLSHKMPPSVVLAGLNLCPSNGEFVIGEREPGPSKRNRFGAQFTRRLTPFEIGFTFVFNPRFCFHYIYPF